MGRLTLNVLLSFAQFEREVTGERIRDKIAVSKRKGMWMGGLVPLGYDVTDRRLVVNESEAKTVREIFRRYLELGSVRLLMEDLNRRGVRSKVRVAGNGKRSGGNSFFRGALYALLSNPIYVGEIRHKGVCIRDCMSRSSIGSCGTRRNCYCEATRFGAHREQRNRLPVRSRVGYSTKAARVSRPVMQ